LTFNPSTPSQWRYDEPTTEFFQSRENCAAVSLFSLATAPLKRGKRGLFGVHNGQARVGILSSLVRNSQSARGHRFDRNHLLDGFATVKLAFQYPSG
jgi:hypothetical protein